MNMPMIQGAVAVGVAVAPAGTPTMQPVASGSAPEGEKEFSAVMHDAQADTAAVTDASAARGDGTVDASAGPNVEASADAAADSAGAAGSSGDNDPDACPTTAAAGKQEKPAADPADPADDILRAQLDPATLCLVQPAPAPADAGANLLAGRIALARARVGEIGAKALSADAPAAALPAGSADLPTPATFALMANTAPDTAVAATTAATSAVVSADAATASAAGATRGTTTAITTSITTTVAALTAGLNAPGDAIPAPTSAAVLPLAAAGTTAQASFPLPPASAALPAASDMAAAVAATATSAAAPVDSIIAGLLAGGDVSLAGNGIVKADASIASASPFPPGPLSTPVRVEGLLLRADAPMANRDRIEFGEAIGVRLAWLAGQQVSRADITVSPPELGPIKVQLEIDGKHVRAEFQSAHGEVRAALEAGLPRLREMLAGQGMHLAHAGVGHGDGGAARDNNQADAQRRDVSPRAAIDDARDNHGETVMRSPGNWQGAGLLDEYA